MKKLIALIVLLLAATHFTFAQNATIAKLKFESAQESYSKGEYMNCIQKLDEAQKLAGKSNPLISHLKILVYDKWLEDDRNYKVKNTYLKKVESHLLEHLSLLIREGDFYMKNYAELTSVEEKTREVFKIQEKFEKEINKYKNVKGFLTTIEAAQTGNADSEYRLAKLYEEEELNQTALSWYIKSANNGNVDAMLYVANHLTYLRYIKPYESESKDAFAIKYLFKAIEKGNAKAMYQYAGFLSNGEKGLPKDIPAALELLEKAFQNGEPAAYSRIGYLYYIGEIGNSPDYAKAMEYYNKAIDKGYVYAYSGIAVMYIKGQGVETDYAKAMACYQKILIKEPKDASVHFSIGDLYKNGFGVEKNYSKAMEWYQKAVDINSGYNEIFASEAGVLFYEGGYGLTQDYNKAYTYFKQSDYFETSMYYLGQMHEKGLGVPKDYLVALSWYQKAAEENYPDAMRSIGQFYELGLGVKKDKKIAQEWYTKADAAAKK